MAYESGSDRVASVTDPVTGASTYTNDADGNTLSNTPVAGGGRTMAWDSQNRLASCKVGNATTTYAYGADGLRRRAFTYQPIHHGPATQGLTADPDPETAIDIGTSMPTTARCWCARATPRPQTASPPCSPTRRASRRPSRRRT